MKSKQKLLLLGLFVVLGFIGCAIQPRPTAYDPPGFFMGIIHGFTSLFSLIGSMFMNIRIYSFPNSGGWYDFGYIIGVSMFFGTSGSSLR